KVRIDHFRAFSAYWQIPAEAEDAVSGRWIEGPGEEFFHVMQSHGLCEQLIAEDLGVIDQPVRDLLKFANLPGMRVLQFAFGEGAQNEYLPHNYNAHTVVFTGTHDNNTTLGWWSELDEWTRHHVRSYLGVD